MRKKRRRAVRVTTPMTMKTIHRVTKRARRNYLKRDFPGKRWRSKLRKRIEGLLPDDREEIFRLHLRVKEEEVEVPTGDDSNDHYGCVDE
jgi:hypothetical protein